MDFFGTTSTLTIPPSSFQSRLWYDEINNPIPQDDNASSMSLSASIDGEDDLSDLWNSSPGFTWDTSFAESPSRLSTASTDLYSYDDLSLSGELFRDSDTEFRPPSPFPSAVGIHLHAGRKAIVAPLRQTPVSSPRTLQTRIKAKPARCKTKCMRVNRNSTRKRGKKHQYSKEARVQLEWYV